MNLDKDTLDGLSKVLSKFVVLTAPGLAINEFVFHKGFYGGGMLNIYDVLLLLLWSAFFSLPYYICLIVNIAWHHIRSKEELKKAENDPELFETSLPLLFILIVLNYIMFKILLFLNWLNGLVKFGIQQQYALLVVSVVITCIISFPLGKIYFTLFEKFASKIRHSLHKRFSK